MAEKPKAPVWTMFFAYGPPTKVHRSQHVDDVVDVGYYVLVKGSWQKVMAIHGNYRSGTLVTEYGDTLPLEKRPPEEFRYRAPSIVPAMAWTAIGTIAAIIAAVASIIALFK